ncbi:MAG: HAMP domain-containing sensor histidine kinase [Thermodesulfobacteriota bacterium]|nr:HAMP domain-containing sensor histidine kinase [Thermodesulfobacteriota bacterium]
MDVLTLIRSSPLPNFVSYTILGVIGLSIVLCYSFTQRLISLITEREKSFSQLQIAYQELEEARSLSELGKFSAIINHEIRNYATAIRWYAEFVKHRGGLSEKFRTMLGKVITSVNHLTEFSNEILDFSKTKVLKEKNSLNICELIRQCVLEHFPDKIDSFSFVNMDRETVVYGEQGKLERIFVNMFKNSFEAQATCVVVKIFYAPLVKLIVIEDDGVGCDAGNLEKIFNAFHTTKKKGTGLGMSIVRSIIEGHGGHINVVSKNIHSRNEHGMIFSITFPAYQPAEQEIENKENSTVLIKKGIDSLETVIRTFRNVYLHPDIIQDVSDFKPKRFSPSGITIIGNPDTIGQITERYSEYSCFSVASSEDGGLYVQGNRDDLYSGIFSEEFVVSHLLRAA